MSSNGLGTQAETGIWHTDGDIYGKYILVGEALKSINSQIIKENIPESNDRHIKNDWVTTFWKAFFRSIF